MARSSDKRKHKPSAKHALDDVLHSLQDLVHNELSDDDIPPDSDPERIVQSLKALIHDRGTEAAEIEEITLTPVPPEAAQAEPAGEASQTPHPPVDPPGKQLLIPGTEDMGSVAPTPAAEDESGREAAPNRDTGPKKRRRRKVRQAEMDWDDIPVLNDIAAPPPSTAAGVPSADRARDIAVRTIAKLNIELRKRGERGLDPITIDRLQQLLQEELEQQAANVDNKHDSAQP